MTIGPLLWMVSTSLKGPGEIFSLPPKWIPNPPVWANYVEAWNAAPFGLFFYNTCLITFSVVVGRLFICSLGGYAFARLRFPGSQVAFALLLGAMLIPGTVTLIPQYYMFRLFGWIDTPWPLIMPGVFANTFGTFLLRQFFMTIPDELEDAARIDGASSMQIYHRIMLPQAKPALAALGIFTFMGSWNDFMGPLIYLNTYEKMTLQVGLAQFQGEFYTDWQLLMAASVIVLLPVLLVYLFCQRYFIEGITLTGLKG
ncbi:MAG: carbohydrate ABC transporter permease [Firmicutes bacterium]|nr:carbohydrate ABC transporter permease [Bacillota bacterium]